MLFVPNKLTSPREEGLTPEDSMCTNSGEAAIKLNSPKRLVGPAPPAITPLGAVAKILFPPKIVT